VDFLAAGCELNAQAMIVPMWNYDVEFLRLGGAALPALR